MSKKINDGGFTFPVPNANGHNGMSLRDHFAGQALVGIIACFRDHEGATTVCSRVRKAYEYADLMIAASEAALKKAGVDTDG